MLRRLVGLVVMLSVCYRGLADEVVPPPKDVPPVLGRAVVSKPGTAKESSEWTIRLSLPRIAWEVDGEVVPKSQWPELKADVQPATLNLRMGGPSALAPSRVLDFQGKELSRDQVLKRLAQETPVLVSVSGRMRPYARGFVIVSDTPHYAVTDADGQATVAGLPPGNYKVSLWHESLDGKQAQKKMATVVSKAGETSQLRLWLPAPK